MSGRTYAVTRYRPSDTYVHVTADYVFEKQLHGYVVYLQIYVQLLIARHGVTRQCMHCRIGMLPMKRFSAGTARVTFPRRIRCLTH